MLFYIYCSSTSGSPQYQFLSIHIKRIERAEGRLSKKKGLNDELNGRNKVGLVII